jgi:hypothetical protein
MLWWTCGRCESERPEVGSCPRCGAGEPEIREHPTWLRDRDIAQRLRGDEREVYVLDTGETRSVLL